MIGMMRYIFMLQRPSETTGPGGTPAIEWTDIREIHADSEGAGSESMQSSQMTASTTWRLKVHHDPDLKPGCRLKDGNRALEIISVDLERKPVPLFAVVTAHEVLT